MKDNNLIIGLTGDVMLGRLVNEAISIYGYKYPWGNLLPLLKKNDLNLINLETTLTSSTKAVPKTFNFKADPDRVHCLQEANVGLVNLANNHILDFGEEGLRETIDTLQRAGILIVGAGRNKKEAEQPVFVTVKGVKIGILGCQDNEPSWEAQSRQPGTNYISVSNNDDTSRIIRQAKQVKKKVDFLIFTIHWGSNMRQRPSKQFQEFAHLLIDAGVDIFHGHSAHLFQGIEVYKEKLILYDSGDFVDDYAVDPELRNDWSFLFLVEVFLGEAKGARITAGMPTRITTGITARIQRVELVPVAINQMQVNQAEGEIRRQIVERMKKLSAEFEISIQEQDDKIIVSGFVNGFG